MCKVSNTTRQPTRSDSKGKSSDDGESSEPFSHIKAANRKVRLIDILRHYGFKIEKNPQRPNWSNNLKCPLPSHKGAKERTPSFGYNFVGDHCHCLAGSTRVLTKYGTFEIKDLIGKNLLVLGKNGNWVEAEFNSYGCQKLFKITLIRNQKTKIIYCTDEHRWFVQKEFNPLDNVEVLTKNLKQGQRLSSMFPNYCTLQMVFLPFCIDMEHRFSWVVQSVEETNREEDVYCADVKNGHAFTLEDNILTGNCFGCGFTGRAVEFIAAYEGVSRTSVAEKILSQYGEDVSSGDFKDYEDDISPILFECSKYIQIYVQKYKNNPKVLTYIDKLIWWLDFYLAQKAPTKNVNAEELRHRFNRIKELINTEVLNS